jgi:predicted GTPase
MNIELSLISHTNVGKTTLARTLLGRDIGEVRDAPHVTDSADPHTMIETAAGDALRLWDTPGFGDTARLLKRLKLSGNPIGWFLSEVWDRWRDRPFWSSQQAVRNVREEADVVLYLVSALEDPGEAGYVAHEMQILAWIGKPVIVLLNQAGQPRPRVEEEAEEARWRAAVTPHTFVHAVLSLDAFARCWVQEMTLLRAVARALPEEKRAVFARLEAAWQARRMAEFDASMDAIASELTRAACDREPLDDPSITARLREVGKAIGIARASSETSKDRAMRALADRLDNAIRTTTDRLIAIHRLEGSASAKVLARLASSFDVQERMNEGKAAVLGGVVSGALSGLAADLGSGGLTFGAGLLTGGLLGALGAAGLARAFNLVRGRSTAYVRWGGEFLDGLVAAALLRYLAVAHYGRGRGEWTESEAPPFWQDVVASIFVPRAAAFNSLWAGREESCETGELTAPLRELLRATALDLLERLYPSALRAAPPGEEAKKFG